uniref:Exportin-6 n=2 Tax=Cacopsylla melanoneura TaxID=428564 RepID=A0A8D8VFL5_9HEMI
MEIAITPEVQEKLNSLEKLLFEFYDPNTNNLRKQELEKIFEDFSNDANVWKHVRDFVKFSSNFYVIHFSLMVIENTLKVRGVCSDSEAWTEMKYLLQSRVLTMEGAPSYIVNKLVKINAHVARIDWPHFYPDYFPNIFKLLQSSNNEFHIILGAKFLQITSEEFLSPREDISYARKNELKNFLQTRVVPEIFASLLRALEVWKSNLKIIAALLESFEQYFSWVPLGEVYSVALIHSISQFTPKLEVGVLSLSTLNEILYKALVPVSFMPVLSHVIAHSFTLIHNLATLPLCNIPDEYIKKVIEQVHLVVTHHWHRVDSAVSHQTEVSPLEFLTSFVRFTFETRAVREHLYECLTVWASLVDQLSNTKQTTLVQYKPVMSSLLSRLLEEIKASSCLDDELLNEDNKTDKQESLDHCNDLIAKITELFPEETFNLVLSYWVPASLTYAEFLSSHNASHSSQTLEETLSAMCNYTQVLTRIHQCVEARYSDLVRKLSQMALEFTRTQVYCKPELGPISILLVQVQSEILASLKCWLSNGFPYEEAIFHSLHCASLPLILDKTVPAKLSHSAVHLLSSVILHRPQCDLSSLETLIVPNSLIHLPLETRVVLESVLIRSILSKPLPSPSDERQFVLQSVVNILVRNSTVECHHLSLLLPHCALTSKQSKQILGSVLEPWLSQVILEYPRHFDKHNYRLCEDMVAFYLESFRIIQDQMPLNLIQNSVQCFIDRFQSGILPETHSILDKLFSLLQVIIEQPSSQFKLFVPSSLDLCTRLLNLDSPHTPKSNAFSLLAIILMEKWQFFFRGSQLDSEAEGPFSTIMTFLGQSCSSPDISLVGQNIRALENIHSRWRLYEKDVFKQHFLRSFLAAFLRLLVEKQHTLLTEELTLVLFHLAQVDMGGFYVEFVPSFLRELTGLSDNQRQALCSQLQSHTDFSTFSQNITQLANDIRCYRKYSQNITVPHN